jgi:hypothetical protein
MGFSIGRLFMVLVQSNIEHKRIEVDEREEKKEKKF